jgi:hypothetical protein
MGDNLGYTRSYEQLNMIISNKPLINQDILVCLLALVHSRCERVEITRSNISELFACVRKQSKLRLSLEEIFTLNSWLTNKKSEMVYVVNK